MMLLRRLTRWFSFGAVLAVLSIMTMAYAQPPAANPPANAGNDADGKISNSGQELQAKLDALRSELDRDREKQIEALHRALSDEAARRIDAQVNNLRDDINKRLDKMADQWNAALTKIDTQRPKPGVPGKAGEPAGTSDNPSETIEGTYSGDMNAWIASLQSAGWTITKVDGMQYAATRPKCPKASVPPRCPRCGATAGSGAVLCQPVGVAPGPACGAAVPADSSPLCTPTYVVPAYWMVRKRGCL